MKEREMIVRHPLDRDAVVVHCSDCTWGTGVSPALGADTAQKTEKLFAEHLCESFSSNQQTTS